MGYLSTTVNWDTIRSLTHPLVSKKIADNITARIPFFHFLNKFGHKEFENGGDNYQLPVFKELATAQAYTGLTILDNVERDPVTMAIFERKQVTQDITLSGTKLLKNSGQSDTSVVNYMAAQIEMAEEGMKNTLAGNSVGVLSALGESDVGVTGVRNILTDSISTGTCGGLNRATYEWWRHKTDSVATGFNTDGLQSMRSLYFNVVRGDEAPTIILMNLNSYVNLDRALTGTINYNQPAIKAQFGDIGFEHLNFRGSPVFLDDGVPENRAFFLNLKYLKLMVHEDRDMAIRDFITPSNQDALIGRMYWAGNVICNCLARQGLLQGLIETWA